VDTSSLRSTKMLGQKEIPNESTRKQRNWDTSDAESESQEELDTKEPEPLNGYHNETNPFLKNDSKFSVVGAALKKGSGNPTSGQTSNPRKRKQRGTGLSWRERLESTKSVANQENSESSSYMESSSSDSEYSDWSGLSADDDNPKVDAPTDNHRQSESDNETDSSQNGDISTLDGNDNQLSDEAKERVHQQAQDFKNWAREQSGLIASRSNISSLPVLLPEQREAIVASRKKIEKPSIPSENEVGKSPVFPLLMKLMSVVLCRRTKIVSYSGVSALAPNYC
jgi:hypothetical protein